MRCLMLCLVTDFKNKSAAEYQSFLLNAVKGGVTSVQLRAKNKTPHEILQIAKELKTLLTPLQIPLIINDHIEIAREVDAAGVHVGQSDAAATKARELLGPDKIIGLSIETKEQLIQANQLDCIDYVAASAVFPSTNKLDCKTIWGIDGLQKLVKQSRHPVVAIGGINLTNISDVVKTGVTGVAVIGAIHDQSDPEQAAANLLSKINR